MTQEEALLVQPGTRLRIYKRPENGDNAPDIGYEFIVKELNNKQYFHPTISGLGGCWHYSYVELCEVPINNNYEIYG